MLFVINFKPFLFLLLYISLSVLRFIKKNYIVLYKSIYSSIWSNFEKKKI